MQFRPEHDTRIGDDKVDWEDNRLSNFFAWASYKITPSWCQTPEHWTSRLAQYVFTDCPCCLLFRGLSIGILIGLSIGILLSAVVWASLAALP
jgi:hypothetical protein